MAEEVIDIAKDPRGYMQQQMEIAQQEANKSDAEKETDRVALEAKQKEEEAERLKNQEAPKVDDEVATEETKKENEVPSIKNWKDVLEEEEKVAKEEKEKADKIALAQKRVEDLENDELYKTIDALRSQGKDEKEIKKVLKSFLEYEPSEYTDKDLFELAIKEEVNDDGEPLSQYEIDDKYEQFLTMPKKVQEGTLSAQRAMLDAKYEDVKKLIQPKAQATLNYTEAETQAINDLMSLTDEVVGQEIMGANVTTTMAKELYTLAKKFLPTTYDGKGYDATTAFKNAWTIKMLPFIVKEEAKATEHATMKKLFKEFHAPSATGKPVETNPSVVVALTEQQRLEQDMKDKIAQRSDPFGMKQKIN